MFAVTLFRHGARAAYRAAPQPVSIALLTTQRKIVPLTRKEFKRKKIESFEEYSRHHVVANLCVHDKKKLRELYEKYCESRYNDYKREQIIGGNPALMV